MTEKMKSEGFGIVEVLIVLAVIVILVVTSVFLYEHHNKNNALSIKSPTDANLGLTIKRDNSLNQPGVSNFSIMVSHSSAVTILSDINSLKVVPQGAYARQCPLDDGVEYTFSFFSQTLTATASATGCQTVTVNNKSYQSTDKFWKDVSSATHQPIDSDKNLQ